MTSPSTKAHSAPSPTLGATSLTADDLVALAKACGADDAGVVDLHHPQCDVDRAEILHAFPKAKSLMSIVIKINREPIRSPARSIANLEFHTQGEETNHVAARMVRKLQEQGIAALNPAMGFPMEMSGFPGKLWTISHKLIAEAAGMGKMGIHRLVIHPKFGNFIALGTIILDRTFDAAPNLLDYNPCLECKLCVAACPVGAVQADGHFQFDACYTHNYREFMGGFADWVENVADAKNVRDYRKRVSLPETVSMWQSLGYGPNYKAAYCMAVCPAGEEILPIYGERKKAFVEEVLRPLQQNNETLYVVPGTDAEAYAKKRYPHKPLNYVQSGLRPQSVQGFLRGMHMVFQRSQAKKESFRIHFTFRNDPEAKGASTDATVAVHHGKLQVRPGHSETADLKVSVDANWWIHFLGKERNLVFGLLTGRLRLKGGPKPLQKLQKLCPV